METVIRWIYNGLVVPTARLARPLLARSSPKIRRGVEARRELLARWQGIARASGRSSPRLWVHASSAGETLQARPIVEAIREARPEATIWFSFFSPSAERVVEGWEAPDGADYLPFDLRSRMRRMVEVLEPDALLLVGAELWPNLVWAADEAGVWLGQACCRFGEGAGRLRLPMRPLAAALYRRFDGVGAVAGEDAATLRELGLPGPRVEATGDTRVDVTLERIEAAEGPPPWRPPEGAGPVVVAGSTWPADERVVLEAIVGLREAHPRLTAVVAPHEPTGSALERLEREAGSRGLRSRRLGAGGMEEQVDVVLVDRVGILYRLYAVADVAWVGGGLDGSVHNTMEPAAHAVPIAIGPDHGAPHEVVAMERSGGLVTAGTAHRLRSAWGRWLADPARARMAGRAARRTLDRLAGATGRTVAFLERRGMPL